jgi:hypothetical protein
MPAHADTSDLEQFQSPALQLCTHAELREIEAVAVVSPFEAWIARHFIRLHPAKENVKRFAQVNRHRLQRLTEYVLCLREGLPIPAGLLDRFVLADAAPFNLIAPLPIFQAPIVEVSADRQHLEPTLFLCLARIEALLECL